METTQDVAQWLSTYGVDRRNHACLIRTPTTEADASVLYRVIVNDVPKVVSLLQAAVDLGHDTERWGVEEWVNDSSSIHWTGEMFLGTYKRRFEEHNPVCMVYDNTDLKEREVFGTRLEMIEYIKLNPAELGNEYNWVVEIYQRPNGEFECKDYHADEWYIKYALP